MWELDSKEGWALKNWCFRTVVLEKTLKSSLDSKEIKPVNPKENQPWIFIETTDAEAEAPTPWSPDAKIWLIRKDPGAGKDWGQQKLMTEDEMVGRHHWLHGYEFEQTLGDSEGQGSLECCSPCDLKESDMTEWLNNNNRFIKQLLELPVPYSPKNPSLYKYLQLATINEAPEAKNICFV